MKAILSSFSLKIIAIISMTIDHIGFFIFPEARVFRIIGRFAFPLFAFLTATAMHYSNNKIRYISILLMCGAVFSLTSSLYLHRIVPNVFFDLGLGALCCSLFYKKNIYSWSILLLVVLFSVYEHSLVNYGIYGITTILLFYIFYMDKKINIMVFSIWTILCVYLQKFSFFNMYLIEGIYLLLPVICLLLYNGKRGFYHPKWKYMFYIYFPLHITILYFIGGKI